MLSLKSGNLYHELFALGKKLMQSRAISPAPRNMTDEMIAALGKKHGVVQINFSCDFLNPDVLAANAANREKIAAMRDELAKKYANDPLRARGPGFRGQVAEPDARPAGGGLHGGRDPQNVRREHAAVDGRRGARGGPETLRLAGLVQPLP